MIKAKTRKLVEGEELEELTRSIRSVFKLKSDEEFAEKIAKKIAEMVKNGQKVYVTNRAAKVLEPILEKYGIILVPARRIEYPHILIDIPSENTIFIRFKDLELRKIEREISLEIFIKYLEEVLRKYFKERREKRHIISIVSNYQEVQKGAKA